MPPRRKKETKLQSIKKRGRPLGRRNKKNKIARKVKREVEETKEVDEETKVDNEDPYRENIKKGKEDKQEIVGWNVSVKKPIISCKECPKKFRFEQSYANHLLLEHSKLPGSKQCDRCVCRCPNAATLKEHIAKFHDRDLYECSQCKKTFVRHAHVLRHMAQKGCDGSKTYVYPCEICGAHFSRKDNLMVHLRSQHIMQKKYACKQCSFGTSKFSKLCVHMSKHHADEQKFECDHCGKVVTSRPAMCKHLEIHGEKKYACDVCGYRTFTVEVMRRHVLTHVVEKPYKCDKCDASFIQRSQLQRHFFNTHTTKYTCPECHATADNKNEFLEHMKIHKGGNESILNNLVCPYQSCSLFNKKFVSKKDFKQHMMTHEVTSSYACEVCGKLYRNESDMKRHVMSHTLERPRRCMYCVQARAYVRGMQLVRHVRKKHEAVFKDHLAHVRAVLGSANTMQRVKLSEMESILNVLDAEADRILEGYGEGVLYGGMQETGPEAIDIDIPPAITCKKEDNPLMCEEDLAENLNKLLVQLIDKELLECFGWPTESVDTVLEKVISHCGAKPADREKWSRVQRLRENTKHLFLYVIEDKNIMRMLDSHTIDQIVKHILTQVTDPTDGGDDLQQGYEE